MSREFGIYPENKVPKIWWGARAIATNRKYGIDVPYDRQNYEGEKDEDFLYWINHTVFPALNKKLKNYETEHISFDSESGRFHCEAADRGSGGYLYIGCWEV
ncbi:MAG: hypothetical protein AB7D36_05470 [Oscillospiraceae bacterium]